MSDCDILNNALALFGVDVDGRAHISISVFELGSASHGDPTSPFSVSLRQRLTSISQGLGFTIMAIDRISKSKAHASSCALLAERWRFYVAADIHLFHFEFRALLDDVAQFLRTALHQENNFPRSFNDLKKGVRSKFAKHLSQDLAQLLSSTAWFDDMCRIRDQIIHYGAEALVFDTQSDDIAFQVYNPRATGLVSQPILMFNENVVYFDRYAALLTANLLIFLHAVGNILCRSLSANAELLGTSKFYTCGIDVLQGWVRNLQQIICQQEAVGDVKSRA